ncbi:hypothetical protein ES707_22389 [subsurface metagenome]
MPLPKEQFCHISHAELVHKSGVVHKGPCLITGFSVTGYGADGVADLYDGVNTRGEHKCKVSVISKTTFDWPIVHPVDFDTGIYIAVEEETTYVTICYIPESWKEFV